jgi:hypothetical protein
MAAVCCALLTEVNPSVVLARDLQRLAAVLRSAAVADQVTDLALLVARYE